MKKGFLLAPLAAALAVVAAAFGGNAASDRADVSAAPTATEKALITCGKTRSIAIMAPITGPVAFLGTEQLNWAKFAVIRWNAANQKKFRLIEGDTQLDPARASTVAQRLASNRQVLGVVGPAGSQEVLAAAPIFKGAGVGFVSASATRVTLTDGSLRGFFFRVVPHDGIQAPTDANYMVNALKVKRVMVIDDQTAYGVPLADAVAKLLEARRVTVDRESVRQQQTDFSALVAKIHPSTNVVFLAHQVAADATLLARQMTEQGKRATIFGSDGLFSPNDFLVDGSYVSAFAPDIRGIPANAALIKAYNKRFGSKWGTFGPPTYLATQVIMRAVATACTDGKATRAEVRKLIAKTSLKTTVLGIPLSFTANGDPKAAKFFIFQIKNGKYVLVG